MRISILVKTFLILLVSFSFVFFLSVYISYKRFSPMYIDENIKNVKTSLLSSVALLENGVDLKDTPLKNLSTETSFIRFSNHQISEEIGPKFLEESEILDFVIQIYDSPNSIRDGQMIYFIEQKGDIYHINYIYQFDIGDYLFITTRIQSLQNIDRVLNNINITQSIFMMIAIIFLSIVISLNISHPIKKISLYAKDISNLKFSNPLNLKRKDEFQDLISSLNEMTFNLKKTYSELALANQKLSSDIHFEKEQEEKKKHLIMTINHEIKTPLSVMKGMIEGMIDGVGRYKDKEKYLKELLIQIESIEQITHDLTYSMKLEDKMIPDGFCKTDLIHEMNALDELAKQHMVKLIKKVESCDILMSEELFKILATNLIKNAILYSENRIVNIYGVVTNDTFILKIRNQGELLESEINKIFDSYTRSNQTRDKKPGSGLGLFIVKQIATLYDYPYKIFNDSGEVVAKVEIKIKK
jgi:two-component system, OmpR family, sensor histidine kinase VanS